ncbi:MAG: thiamine pyrophosphate-dependent enzyme [Balneolaceae bacterium]
MSHFEVIKSKKSSDKGVRETLRDYKLARVSREISLLGEREALLGRAKFGIFGDGKELAQIAMSSQFRKGDFRSGYYRDQTFMLAIGELTPRQFFAQLYAHPDVRHEPCSAGRMMNGHFATRLLNEKGEWVSQTDRRNTAADMSPTAAQMPRLLGLAQASKVYRDHAQLHNRTEFSRGGREVAFGTIGDASTSEGIFWETINAAGVLQVPLVVSVWDDGFGISVEKKYQTTKESISKALEGFRRTENEKGIEIFRVKAWDYTALMNTYSEAVELAREHYVPVLVHVEEATQPLGHSTSGSHERYKSKERLQWEEEYCCCRKMRSWLLKKGHSTPEELDRIEQEAKDEVKQEQKRAWEAIRSSIQEERRQLEVLLESLATEDKLHDEIQQILTRLEKSQRFFFKDVITAGRKALRLARSSGSEARKRLSDWMEEMDRKNRRRYNSHLISESIRSPLHVEEVRPVLKNNSDLVDGRVVLRNNFDKLLSRYPELLIFGEDSGRLGDVNLGLEGLQKKYGEFRVGDTGIREATIIGQGIGLALRGLRPIAEIQYLDYLLYCIQGLSDDLASLRYRTAGGQKAPLIVRTRGHRLEGIWHSGSPMGMIINSLRGVHVCVPRNLTDAAGFYNTLLRGDDPALVIEPLNAYRKKEQLPENLGEFTVPLGVPELVREGRDITVVSYGSTCNLIESVLPELARSGISVELIDVRTLLPFDRYGRVLESLKKTNRICFIDEDVPGGATGFMMQQVLDLQGGFRYLDSAPRCLTAKAHRTAYSTDGDYFSKPNADDIFETIWDIMSESSPGKFTPLS